MSDEDIEDTQLQRILDDVEFAGNQQVCNMEVHFIGGHVELVERVDSDFGSHSFQAIQKACQRLGRRLEDVHLVQPQK